MRFAIGLAARRARRPLRAVALLAALLAWSAAALAPVAMARAVVAGGDAPLGNMRRPAAALHHDCDGHGASEDRASDGQEAPAGHAADGGCCSIACCAAAPPALATVVRAPLSRAAARVPAPSALRPGRAPAPDPPPPRWS